MSMFSLDAKTKICFFGIELNIGSVFWVCLDSF